MEYFSEPYDSTTLVEGLQLRGLSVADEEAARKFLDNVNYFRIHPYLRAVEADHNAHRYRQDCSFDMVADLYRFDCRLKIILFEAIQQIEVALRARIIRVFSLLHGPFWFTDESLFSDKSAFFRTLGIIEDTVDNSQEGYIRDHWLLYETTPFPPAWKTLEVLSFSTISFLYRNFTDKQAKKAVAREFGLPQHLFLESWIRSIAVLRNICAHHIRLWNRKFNIKPRLPRHLDHPWITRPCQDINRLYPILTAVAYLTDRLHPASDFKRDLKALIASHPSVNLSAMGFPQGWRDEPLWE